jgi:hypothetical protein
MTDIVFNLRTGQFDNDTAFSNARLAEEIYRRILEGYVRYVLEVHKKVIDPSTCVSLLTNAINVLVQAARQW